MQAEAMEKIIVFMVRGGPKGNLDTDADLRHKNAQEIVEEGFNYPWTTNTGEHYGPKPERAFAMEFDVNDEVVRKREGIMVFCRPGFTKWHFGDNPQTAFNSGVFKCAQYMRDGETFKRQEEVTELRFEAVPEDKTHLLRETLGTLRLGQYDPKQSNANAVIDILDNLAPKEGENVMMMTLTNPELQNLIRDHFIYCLQHAAKQGAQEFKKTQVKEKLEVHNQLQSPESAHKTRSAQCRPPSPCAQQTSAR